MRPLTRFSRPTHDADVFWSKVNKHGTAVGPELGPCWIWTGATDRAGYGHLVLCGRLRLAHRLSYLWAVDSVPADLDVLHQCDVKACVRPDHLYLGNASQNLRDTWARRPGYREHMRAMARAQRLRELGLDHVAA